MMSRACFTPPVAEFTCAASETRTHIGIPKDEDGAGFIHALSHNKLKMTILVLCNAQVGHRTEVRIELGQVSAASLAVEHRDDLHGGLFFRDISISGTGVTDDTDILVKVDRIHLT